MMMAGAACQALAAIALASQSRYPKLARAISEAMQLQAHSKIYASDNQSSFEYVWMAFFASWQGRGVLLAARPISCTAICVGDSQC